MPCQPISQSVILAKFLRNCSGFSSKTPRVLHPTHPNSQEQTLGVCLITFPRNCSGFSNKTPRVLHPTHPNSQKQTLGV